MFQNLISVINRILESLHDLVIVWLVVILAIVLIIRYYVLTTEIFTELVPDSVVLEIAWTLIPIVILVSIAVPRILLLCNQDSVYWFPKITIKVISNQWNWQRDRLDLLDHLLDSEKLDELSSYEYPLTIPFIGIVRVLLTRRDVLHSLGIPSLGIKIDSNPGRLNCVTFEPGVLGVLTGSCYELCGRGHRAMPIFLKVI